MEPQSSRKLGFLGLSLVGAILVGSVILTCGKTNQTPNFGPQPVDTVAVPTAQPGSTVVVGTCPAGQAGTLASQCDADKVCTVIVNTCKAGTDTPQTQVNAQHLDLAYVSTAILTDAGTLSADDRANARYLVLSHKYDTQVDTQGKLSLAAGADLRLFIQGMNKGMNGLSTDREIHLLTPVDARQTIFRLKLSDFGLTAADWNALTTADPFKFIDNTQTGKLVQQILGSAAAPLAQPWLHADNAIFRAQDTASVYYQFTKQGASEAALEASLGVNVAADSQDAVLSSDLYFLGSQKSQISLGKFRLLARDKTKDGYFWRSFDTDQGNKTPQANLFNFPLVGTGTAKFGFQASEIIFTLPNGLQGYALANAAGARQNVAPLTVVQDNQKPGFISAEIRNASSCARCHGSVGLIPYTDEVKAAVRANANGFTDVKDPQRVDVLFKTAAENLSVFAKDNALYQSALQKLAVASTDPESVTYLQDSERKPWTAADLAGYLLLTPDEFQLRLAASQLMIQEIGALRDPKATLGLDQIEQFMPDILKEFRFGQDDLNKQ